MTRPAVVLIGSMGAGKSTVGRLLAQRLDVAFLDTDDQVEHIAGKAVADIFVEDGEPAFRAMERDVVAAALTDHGGVLALGGGAVMDPTTRDRLAGHRVVHLRVGLPAAAARVGLGVSRPLLLGNVRAQLKARLDERDPIYGAVATVVVDTDDRTPEQVAAEIIDWLAEALR